MGKTYGRMSSKEIQDHSRMEGIPGCDNDRAGSEKLTTVNLTSDGTQVGSMRATGNSSFPSSSTSSSSSASNQIKRKHVEVEETDSDSSDSDPSPPTRQNTFHSWP